VSGVFRGKALRKNNLSNYCAGLLPDGEARRRRMSAWTCNSIPEAAVLVFATFFIIFLNNFRWGRFGCKGFEALIHVDQKFAHDSG
jgi:hypothetical protein